MKMKNYVFLSAILLVAFSIFITVIAENSFAGSAKPLAGDDLETERIKDHKKPVFSPDKRRFFTIPEATREAYSGVFVWRVEGSEIVPEFSYESEDFATYKKAKWKGNRTIEFTKWVITSGGPCPETAFMLVDIELRMKGDGWKVHEDFKPGSPRCVNGW
ncbi:MAG: hypothetical protein V3V95_06990 [Thermodesulfobacteriota bacterium]